MYRNVTAIYRDRKVAETVRRELEDAGVPAGDIYLIPDPVNPAEAGRADTGAGATDPADIPSTGLAPTTGPLGAPVGRSADPLMQTGAAEAGLQGSPTPDDRLHALHLPDEDFRTYQHAVRDGDHVVSAEVDDGQVAVAVAVMRRSEFEARDIDSRAPEFRDEDPMAHSPGEDRATLSEEYRARRLTPGSGDPVTRTYERNRRLDRS